jgi:hypothetical protein
MHIIVQCAVLICTYVVVALFVARDIFSALYDAKPLENKMHVSLRTHQHAFLLCYR